jgi:sialidase-1
VVMAIRTQLGSPYVSRSDDQGDTWSQPWSSGLESPESPLGMTAFPDGSGLLLVYCSGKFDPKHHHSGERTPLSAAVSGDGGKTWRKLGEIAGGNHEFGSSGNNSICFPASGKVVIAYTWSRIPWDRTILTGGVRVAIADRKWFEQN